MPERTPTNRIRLHPSAFLLAAQLLQLALFAIFEGLQFGHTVITIFGVVVLVLRVWVVRRSPGVNWIAWTLAVPTLILSILSAFSIHPTLLVITYMLEAVFYFYTAGSLIAYMMADYQVTADEWFAAGATFTLLAWGFAYAYMTCQAFFQAGFINCFGVVKEFTFPEMLSLSFTNLTATGLSDILPANTTARVLIMLEQFAGIGFVAVVISRMVALALARSGEKK
ncbi:MAG: ion channel [Anaerolineaceae bacterium]